MLKTLLLVTTFLFVNLSFGQTSTFVPGWFIVEKGASYTNYDLLNFAFGGEAINNQENLFALKVGETVFATDFSGDVYYCFDPTGTPILIKGKASLTKATTGFGVGIIVSAIQLVSGESLEPGMFVWITGQDVVKQTITIKLADQEVLEIPETKIALLTALIKKNSKATWFKEAE
jgi:hypothetical protein